MKRQHIIWAGAAVAAWFLFFRGGTSRTVTEADNPLVRFRGGPTEQPVTITQRYSTNDVAGAWINAFGTITRAGVRGAGGVGGGRGA